MPSGKKLSSRTGRDADPRRVLPLNGAAWQKLRAYVLAEQPLCLHCLALGRIEQATDVDHKDGNPGNNDRENLQGLCHSCHSRKTAADHGKRVAMGCDVHGMPLDPKHPWNIEKSLGTGAARPSPSTRFNANRKETP